LRDPAQWPNPSMKVKFFDIENCQWTFNKGFDNENRWRV
jgi:hypothetical protein